MPKRPRRKPREFYDWTDEDWKKWGEEFGERMDNWGKNFGKRMEQRSKEKEWKERWFWTWGILGPLLGSVFGVIGLVILVWILKFINLPLNNAFISGLATFLLSNLYWFFAAWLFFGYNHYFSWRFRKAYWIVAPITTSISIVIAMWLAILALNFVNTFTALKALAYVSTILYSLMVALFVLFIVIGYMWIIFKKLFLDFLNF
jgi:hypothetical protein